MTVGSYLRQAREAAGFSIDDVATRTRIRASVIKDLESENFESSGGKAYARGHIRTMATMLNADIDLILQAFEETTGESTRSMIELLEENSATVLRRKNRAKIKFSPKIIGIALSIIAGIAIIIPTGLALSSSITSKSANSSSVAKSPSIAAAQTKSSMPSPAATQSAPTASTAGHSVVIAGAHGSSWISVTDNSGTLLFSGMLTNGSMQTFDPTNGLYVRIGNAGAVSVSVNGKDEGAIGAMGEVKTLTFAPAQTNG